MTKEEFSEKLKKVPYDEDFKEFLERTTAKYVMGKHGIRVSCEIDENGIGNFKKE